MVLELCDFDMNIKEYTCRIINKLKTNINLSDTIKRFIEKVTYLFISRDFLTSP